jgi:hypothetical protein
MLDEERALYRENVKQLQKQLKEKCDKDLAEVTKSMNDTYRAKEQEIKDLKIAYKQKDIALTALTSQHTILQMKSTAQNGADGYAQLQKNVKELQAKLKIKEDECELYEKQCIFLTEAFQLQGMNLPAEVPVDTPAPAPAPAPADPHDPNLIPGWDFTSEERARQEIASHGWGNVQQSNVVNNNGWGDTPAHAPSPSPQPTLDGSHTGVSDVEQTYGRRNHRGPGKGSWKGRGNHGSNQYGKRGRESQQDRRRWDDRDNRNDRDRSDRDVRQKTWASDGKSIAVSWAKSSSIRTYMRSLSLPALKALLSKLRKADLDFQTTMRDVHIEKWHEMIDETLLPMHKDLGMPIKLSVSPHFYYQAAMWPCNNAINALANTETLEEIRGRLVWREKFNAPAYDDDISSCQGYDIPDNVRQLGQTNPKTFEDYKIACHHLELQVKQTKLYEARRKHFFEVAILDDVKRPTYTFLDKSTHVAIKRTCQNLRQTDAPSSFNRIFDTAYKTHFTNIRDEIELFATHQTPMEYVQRNTPDITNLYYFNDDGTAVQEAL